MLSGTKHLLAASALVMGISFATPAFSDTVVRETVTTTGSPESGAMVRKTVTETTPVAPATVHTTVTETPDGAVVRKTVTETTPAPVVHTTVMTTEQPAAVTTVTRWHEVDPATGAHIVHFMDFDLNGDRILSTNEIGEMLFKLYDTDNNNVIDNIEYGRRAAVTVMPMEKDTVVSYDFDGDGRADETRYTYDTFMEDTRLARFDSNHDGLSPAEFTGRSFLEADINNDKAIDLKEWKGSYIASIDQANKDKARFNH